MARTADRCQETSTTTGTGTLTLLGAVAQFQAFQTAFSVGDVVQYAIVGQAGTEWETGEGTLASMTTLSRDRVRQSSNANAAVTLSAGTKDVFTTALANSLRAGSMGRTITLASGMALP